MRQARTALLLLLAYGAISFAFLGHDFIGDKTFFAFGDASLQSYPWLLKVARAAREGELALWGFGTEAGVSFAGELNQAPFYLPTIGLGVLGLDGIRLCNDFILLHFVMAACFMHMLLRGEGLRHRSAMLGAMLFALCGYLPFQPMGQPNIFASLCWIPLVIHLHRASVRATSWCGRLSLAGCCGLAGAMQIMAGHVQPFGHTCYALGILACVEAVARPRRRSLEPLLLLVYGQVMAIAFAAIQLELANQYLHQAYRWTSAGITQWPHAISFNGYLEAPSLLWSDLQGLLVHETSQLPKGGLYITYAGILLCLVALARLSSFQIAMWTTAGFALLVAVGGGAGSLAEPIYHLPLIGQIRTPIRAVCLLSFAAAALAAIGLDVVIDTLQNTSRIAATAIVSGLMLANAGEIAKLDRIVGAPNTAPTSSPAYHDANPALEALIRLSNDGPLMYRYFAEPRDLIPPNAGDIKPVLGIQGQRATYLKTTMDYISRNWDPLTSKQMDRLGVKWLVTENSSLPLKLVAQGDGFHIYERPNALPVLWSRSDGAVTPVAVAVEEVTWDHDRVRFDLAPFGEARRITFAQPTYQGWSATVDAKHVSIGQEEIFMTVEVPPGARELAFSYAPHVIAGRIATAAASLLLVVTSFLVVRRRGKVVDT